MTQKSQATQATQVSVTVTVAAPLEKAFTVFTERFDTWWPYSHHLGNSDLEVAVLEPRVGGRWYERTTDGAECDWGTVLAWDPPGHVAMSWHIGPTWEAVDDPALASRVDVRFVAEAPGRTTVTLTHSELDRHGEGWESLRDSVGDTDGWARILESFTAVAGT
ncbi:MAG TPA: SRPBCC family protein [Nocardioidaceae bacterium]|nr:SRPBCC family protein [Nocardioidaceae bacterium]